MQMKVGIQHQPMLLKSQLCLMCLVVTIVNHIAGFKKLGDEIRPTNIMNMNSAPIIDVFHLYGLPLDVEPVSFVPAKF
jgi:hypothetical protein